jgi:hypothetical protein
MPTTRACPKCGAEAAATRRTCATCGTPLQRPSRWVPLLGALALLALAGLGGILLWAAWPMYEDGTRYAARARPTPATVIQVHRQERSDPSGGSTRYSYDVKVVFQGPAGMQTFRAVTHTRLEPGQVVDVYFDPEDLGQVSLSPPSPGAPLSKAVGFASVGFLLIVVGLGGIVGIVRHRRGIPGSPKGPAAP